MFCRGLLPIGQLAEVRHDIFTQAILLPAEGDKPQASNPGLSPRVLCPSKPPP